MITINLLPPELQKDMQTSKTEFLAIIGSVSLVVISLIIYIAMHFFALDNAQKLHAKTLKERKALAVYEKDHKDIKSIKNQYAGVMTAIANCNTRRKIRFSQRLHDLSQYINKEFQTAAENNEEGTSEKVSYWAESIAVSPFKGRAARGKKVAAGPKTMQNQWRVSVACDKDRYDAITPFFRDLPACKFAEKNLDPKIPLSNPRKGTLRGYQISNYFKFPLTLTFKYVLAEAPAAKKKGRRK